MDMKKRVNGKAKGSTFEREVRKDLEGKYPFVKTCRLANRLLDNCGVDLDGIPFLIQCKAGYDNITFKYEKEYNYTISELKKNFPPESHYHNLPYIFIHKKNSVRGKARPPELTQVTMSYETFLRLINADIR